MYNPSIVRAPPGLCADCGVIYLASLRVTTAHQCEAASSQRAFAKLSTRKGFAGTAVIALDAQLNVLASTWLLSDLRQQWVNGSFTEDINRHRVHDVRLLRFGDELMATWHCHGCAFNVALLHNAALRLSASAPLRLHVWATLWDKFVWTRANLQGRNQAIFSGPPDRRGIPMLTQAWLDRVTHLGFPQFTPTITIRDPFGSGRNLTIRGIVNHVDERNHKRVRRFQMRGRVIFGSPHAAVNLTHGLGTSEEDLGGLSGATPRVATAKRARARGPRLSPSAHLVRVSRTLNGPLQHGPLPHTSQNGSFTRRCTALLGVGHLHHKQGGTRGGSPQSEKRGHVPSRRQRRRRGDERTGDRAGPFRWGSEYSHFFYTLRP